MADSWKLYQVRQDKSRAKLMLISTVQFCPQPLLLWYLCFPVNKWNSLLCQLSALEQQLYCLYTIYTKVCGHPFKLVDLAISRTPVAGRSMKSSTQPCNLHSQTLSVEWPLWRVQWLSTWHRHRMPPFQQVSQSNFCPARVAPVNCKCCYCEVETSRSTTAQLRSGRIHQLTERDRRVLKKVRRKNRLPLHKPKITMRNARRRLEWSKARRHWTQWKRVL